MLLLTRRQTGFKAKALGGVPIQPGAFALTTLHKNLKDDYAKVAG
jgi:hypothetical protein